MTLEHAIPLARSSPKRGGTRNWACQRIPEREQKPEAMHRLPPPPLSIPLPLPLLEKRPAKTRLYYCFCHTLRLAKSCACFSPCVDIYVAVINFKLHAFRAAASSSNYDLSGNKKTKKKKKLRNSHSHLHSQLRNLPKLRLGKLFAKSSTNFSALLWLLCIASTRIKVFTAVTYLYLLQTNILCGLKGGLRVWVAAVLQISRFAIINNASF